MNPKQAAGEKAVEFIKDGMTVGLGTGSTVFYTIQKIGSLVKKGFTVKAVCTSEATHKLASSLEIPIIPMENVNCIDLTIDGADEIDQAGNGIKGGWGALLFEKIVAINSVQNIWVVDDNKLVNKLGKFPVPVEVIPFGHKQVLKLFSELGYKPELRIAGEGIFRTDSNNFIIDLHMGIIPDPRKLDQMINHIPGVVEHGLFIEVVNKVVVANEKNVRIIEFE